VTRKRNPVRGPQRQAAPRRRTGADGGPPAPGAPYWIYGAHAVAAALDNPHRRLLRLLYVEPGAPALLAAAGRRGPLDVAAAERAAIARLLPDGAVHQGVAARVAPLPPVDLEGLLQGLPDGADAAVVVLDRVTDPHNVGAVLRSSAAFGAAAVVVTERHAAPESGALAKAASGALDHVPLVRVTNLARALAALKRAGFWCAGFAADADSTLAEAALRGRVALVLGSEGEGLRRLTRETCDLLVRLPTGGPIRQLNVSNAAAVALYELARGRRQDRAEDDR